MKKLIALTLSLAIILCFSLTSMAALVTFDTVAVDGKTMATTFDDATMTFETTVTGITDQATLLAFQGTSLSTENGTNIEYIDQTTVGDTTKFNYKLKTDPNSTNGYSYTIKVGGSNLTTPLSQVVTPIAQAAAGYTVSGTVSNAAALVDGSRYDMYSLVVGYESDVDVTRYAAYLNDYFKTTVTLVAYNHANAYDSGLSMAQQSNLTRYFANDLAPNEKTVTTVDPTSKAFSFSTVPNGDYFAIFERKGYLTRVAKITVVGDNFVFADDKSLFAGDVDKTIGLSYGIVSIEDAYAVINQIGNDYYLPDYNINCDIVSADGDGNGASTGVSIEDAYEAINQIGNEHMLYGEEILFLTDYVVQ